ncbi:MAG: Arylsulfatase [candidate division BRC1 bacterium ADurb.BinA364]|nr:MAG: Arylsulfatase [candidate division BRC1 bacterium ADurb.BinA364]
MRRPNVLLFLTDQQRWDSTGVHGNPLDLTPNFDRMARRGVDVHCAFTPQPLCGPARACLFTGTYATANGCWRNGIRLREGARTLAHSFAEAGYATHYIGKWHLADREPVPPDQRGGFQSWLGANVIEFTSEKYDCVVYDEAMRRVKLPGYRVDALADAAIRAIDAYQDRPFFLALAFTEPHHQNRTGEFPAPDGYAERYAGRWTPPDLAALGGDSAQHLGGYWGMVKRLDEAFGRVLEALKSLGLLDDTIVLFATDHGCHFRTRNGEYKRSVHESSIRIPMALQGPGFDGGGRIARLVSLVDVAPTLLEAAGLPIPESMQGRSFLPLLRGAQADWPDEIFVQTTESGTGRGIRTRQWKYGIEAARENWDGQGGANVYSETALFDLAADPYELRNLIGFESHARVAGILRERLIRRMMEIGEAAPRIELAPPKKSGQMKVRPAEEIV